MACFWLFDMLLPSGLFIDRSFLLYFVRLLAITVVLCLDQWKILSTSSLRTYSPLTHRNDYREASYAIFNLCLVV